MPLYELLLIARCVGSSNSRNLIQESGVIRELLKSSATHVLDNKGVVRKFENLGSQQLPYRMKRHQEIFDYGSYFTMKFDASPKVMASLSQSLKLNENVIRHSIVKLGTRLGEISNYRAPERVRN